MEVPLEKRLIEGFIVGFDIILNTDSRRPRRETLKNTIDKGNYEELSLCGH
jgi:hypothetical protein